MKKRFTAILVVIAMIVAMLPTTAMAHSGNHDVHDHDNVLDHIRVRIEAGSGGTIYSPGSQAGVNLRHNRTWTFRAVPDEGYRLADWTYHGNEVSGAFTEDDENLSVKFKEKGGWVSTGFLKGYYDWKDYKAQAVFEFVGYDVTLNLGEGGTFDSNGSNTITLPGVPAGNLTVPPYTLKPGYKFVGWSGSLNINSSRTLNAKYEYQITFEGNAQATITGTNPVWTVNHDANAPSVDVAAGYRFDGWSRSLNGFTGPTTVTAKPCVRQYRLTLAKSGHGSFLNKNGVQGVYDAGTKIQLSNSLPVAGAGWIHTRWLNNNTGETVGTLAKITLTEDCTYTAIFESIGSRYVNAYALANGRLNHNINGSYPQGTNIDLNTADPVPTTTGYEFKRWEEYIESSDSWRTVPENGAGEAWITVGVVNDYRAVFGLKDYQVRFEDQNGTLLGTDTVTHGDDADDSVISLPSGTRFDASNEAWRSQMSNITEGKTIAVALEYRVVYDIGTCTLVNGDTEQWIPWGDDASAPTITPPTGHHFLNPMWSSDGTNITAPITILARYLINSYTIDTTVTNGTITAAHTVNHGSDTTVTYSADANHHLVSVTVDGTPVDITTYPTSYTFSGVTADHTIEVVYAIDTYSIDTTVTNGTITPDHTVNHGSDTTVTYSADANHHLVSVTVDGTPVDITTYPTSYTFSGVTTDHTIEVVYAIDTYTIDTTVTNGTITADHTVDHGSDTTVTYSADANHHLVSVTVDGTPVDIATYPDSYTFSGVTTDHTIEVVYAIDTYTIDTTVTNGTITADHTVDHGSDTTVTYSADANHHLVSVTVDGTPVDITTYSDSYTFSGVDADHTIEVVYAIDTYTIDTTVTNGTITPDHTVDHGSDTTVTYSANPNHHLVSVTVDGTPVDITTYPTSYTFSGVTADHTIEVVYEIDTYTIDTTVTNGTITADHMVDHGSDTTVTYSADANHHLVSVTVDGTPVDIATYSDSYTFSGVSTDHTIEVVYAIDTYTIDTTVTNGTITADHTVEHGSDTTVTYSADANHHLVSVTVDGTPVDILTCQTSYSFSGVDADHTIEVVYAIDTFTVAFFERDGITPIGTVQMVEWDQAAVLETAPTIDGHAFDTWVLTGDNDAQPDSLLHVRENLTAVASYIRNGYTVTFLDYDGTVLGTDGVLYGDTAVAPVIPERTGYDFVGWSEPLGPITADLTVTAVYEIKTFTVKFVDYDGRVIETQTVNWNTAAIAPDDPEREGYTFIGWDKAFDVVTTNLTVTAEYRKNASGEEDIPKTEDDEIFDEEVPLAAVPQGGFPWWWILIGVGTAATLFLILFFWKRRRRDEQEA